MSPFLITECIDFTLSRNGSTNCFFDKSEISTLWVRQTASVIAIDPLSFTKKSLTLLISLLSDHDLVNKGGILMVLLPAPNEESSFRSRESNPVPPKILP